MKLYRFLASYRFALVLIFFSALAVVIGTFLEANADSHGLAEEWIYHHPLFQLFLAGYFINILLSALSRYPFKKNHLPFLITHLGLLMIIAGVFIKNHFGIQGHIQLVEGTATEYLTDNKVPAVYVERRAPPGFQSIPLHKLSTLEYYPHAEEKFVSWIFDDEIRITGMPSLPHSPFLLTTDWGKIPVHIENKEGKVWINGAIAFDPYHLEEWVAYDKGFNGYALQAKIPPTLTLMHRAAEHSLLDFEKSVTAYLKEWEEKGTWLNDTPYAPIDWKELPEDSTRALYWIAELFEEEHFLEQLTAKGWPLLAPLQSLPPDEQKLAWMKQIIAIKDQLPSPGPLSPKIAARMLSAYIRLSEAITLESPLFHRIEPKEPPLKREERTPGITLPFGNEKLALIYDKNNTRLKWPTQDGNHLLKFQPHKIRLPYQIRLHQARDIKYPGSDQTASFECSLSINGTPCTLRMNQVHETAEGYRFYLAGMGTIDPYGVRSVQLVVNRDPAKRLLTYPGGILVSLGIILLFFKPLKRTTDV